jgi:tyrosinase
MKTEIQINGSSSPKFNYIAWAPVPARIALVEPDGATDPVGVRLRNQDTTQGGQVVFYDAPFTAEQDELLLTLPADGTPVDFLVGGKFRHPSTNDRDAAIEVVDESTAGTLSSTPLMVRVRKNANELSTGERDRFISALATLNDRGLGKYSDFRNIHTSIADPEAHGDAGFLPWHRAYLLDLERALQEIEASVALPYWRFDQPAPNLFTRDFLGVSNAEGTVDFSAANPLNFWATDMLPGIVRSPRFDTASEPARNALGPVISEAATLLLGGTGNVFAGFRRMEGQPHGRAHTSFGGSLSRTDTAPKDPLFFLLHANVDRLWAKWQWVKRRFDFTTAETYTFLGAAGDPDAARIGHNLSDTMWPWNLDMNPPRPASAPGGDFPASPLAAAPGSTPAVRNMIDFQGVLDPSHRLGFDYDDVPFEL